MNRRLLVLPVLACALAAADPTSATAQTLNLSISPAVTSFPSADPDTVAVVVASPVSIQYRVRGNGGQPWRLTVLASGDLISGSSSIGITAVSWTATPTPPFVNGTLSKTVAQTVAAGTGNVNPAETGALTFRFANSWTYDAGTYTQTVIFTLSAP